MPLVRPVFLVDNLFSPVHYPDVVLSANEEGAGTEAAMFSTLRREDHWSPTTLNVDSWIRATHTQPRAANMLCLWTHNLVAETFFVQASDDGFLTSEAVYSGGVPTIPAAGHVDDPFGVRTEDEMWVVRFPPAIATTWQIYIFAMGAGLQPAINGILGMGYSPTQYDYPWEPDTTEFLVHEQRSDRGVVGRSRPVVPRRGAIAMKMRSDFDYEIARFHLHTRWGAGSPMLLIPNAAQAERAVMTTRMAGSLLGFRADREWPDAGEGRVAGELTWQEHDPLELP